MFFVIVTCRSLFWVLCTIGLFMLALTSIATPKWLIAAEKEHIVNRANSTKLSSDTLGLYNKCVFTKYRGKWQQRCLVYATNFMDISGIAWRACIVFLSIAIFLLGIAAILGVVSFCKQLIRRKSLINLAGTFQAFAGILLIVVVILFPLGWDNGQVKKICHTKDEDDKAEKFKLGTCSMGIAYYAAIGSTAASFFCALFSFVAAKAVFSDDVHDEVMKGKQLVCLP